MPDDANGLTKASSADTAQTRVLDESRFESRLGELAPEELEAITTALCLCIERVPVPLAPEPTKDSEA